MLGHITPLDFMSHQTKRLLIAVGVVGFSTAVARAEIITYDISGTVANTLVRLGTQFVWGCAILAVGIVAAVIISKRK